VSHDQQQALAGKVAVITGASRNIGRAIALALAAEGAAIVVNGRSDEAAARAVVEAIPARGGGAIAHLADAAVERFGHIDILVNNAAVRRPRPFNELSLAEWREITGIILDGAFLCARACVPHMLAASGGTIINIGGAAAHLGNRNRAHVATAKAGLEGLTRALAVELADHGITVNCVVPGTIDTVRGESAGAPGARPHGARALIKRLGRPEEVAALVRHLCLPDAAYITGQSIHVSGGAFLT
jgi:3-oxoacyl-[acyl-carrier protein] reductase